MENTNTANQELQILTEKLHNRIETKAIQSQKYLQVIQDTGNLLNDHVLNVGNNKAISFHSNSGNVIMNVTNGEDKNFTLHKNAVQQLGDKFGITSSYLHKLNETNQEWTADLSAHILNEHSKHTTRQRVLIRSIGNEVRGVLSDQYRRLNTTEIYSKFIKGCNNQGLKIYDCFASDLKSYIEAVTPSIFTIPGDNGSVTHVSYGVRISNSDFGSAALEIRAFIIQVVCLNGMVRDSVLKQVHLGSKLPENLQLSERTYKLDTATTGSAVHDIIDSLFNRQSLLEQSTAIQNAMNTNADYDKELKSLNKVGQISKEEMAEVGTVLTNHRKADGIINEGTTLWNLSQSISAVARDKENQRKRDLEEIAGTLLKKVS